MDKLSKKKLTCEITQYLKKQVEAQGHESHEVKKVFGQDTLQVGDFFQTADSLRLRPAGNQLMRLFFDHETLKLDDRLNSGQLLKLCRIMPAPFFISGRSVVIYSSEHIVMIKLAGGVTSWLNLFN
jgi:phosphoribosylaminoimidazole-succinocarboxamide synthase